MQESAWTIVLFAIFVLCALAFLYQTHQGAKPNAGPPFSIRLGSETLPPAAAMALQGQPAGSTFSWQDKRGYLTAEIGEGSSGERPVRVIGRNSKSSGFAISYWGALRTQGTETRLIYLFSPFIFLAYLAFGAAVFFVMAGDIILPTIFCIGLVFLLALTVRQGRSAVKAGVDHLAGAAKSTSS